MGVYDDMLNIVSPGGLPNGLTRADLSQGRSEIRNRVLARVFKALGYIEQWGSGIARISHYFEQAALPAPTLSERGDFVDWEFPRLSGMANDGINDGINRALAGESVGASPPVDPKYHALLTLLRQHPSLTTSAIAEQLNLGTATVERYLKSLKAQGVLKRIGANKGGYWQVNQ